LEYAQSKYKDKNILRELCLEEKEVGIKFMIGFSTVALVK
jgi:hypothetical protein